MLDLTPITVYKFDELIQLLTLLNNTRYSQIEGEVCTVHETREKVLSVIRSHCDGILKRPATVKELFKNP